LFTIFFISQRLTPTQGTFEGDMVGNGNTCAPKVEICSDLLEYRVVILRAIVTVAAEDLDVLAVTCATNTNTQKQHLSNGRMELQVQ